MSAVSVNERRDKQIQDALDSRNYKQALQLCDKRIKKGEKNDYLLVSQRYAQHAGMNVTYSSRS